MVETAVIVPHTHWDREWYLPFQRFRYNLVGLIDTLLETLNDQDYQFMLDGQTVVLEDYLEIRPEKKEELLRHIQAGKIVVGPWYLLPDEWLVGAESLIRNLEYSHDLAKLLQIPLMRTAYLPDQFGHTSAIPQLVRNLTAFRAAVLWRGVPPSIMTTVFEWKSDASSRDSLLTIYMPGGYGNAARFPEKYEDFVDSTHHYIDDLRPFSPVSVFLLMNGSDHLFPQPFVSEFARRLTGSGLEISVGSLDDYLDILQDALKKSSFATPVHKGEFRSPARAHMLQDTYSARMWIKQWNQRVEDLLLLKAEPIRTHLWCHHGREYPTGFLRTAWRWLLQNQPHDSICGCSVDQTHEEMKARFSWAQSIGEGVIDSAMKAVKSLATPADETHVLVFHAGPATRTNTYFEFSVPEEMQVRGLKGQDGEVYGAWPLRSRGDVFMDITMGVTAARMAMRMLPGRKIESFYINGVEYHDGIEPGLLELRISADHEPIGDFDVGSFKKQAQQFLASKKYKKIHLVAARPTQKVYSCVAPLVPWSFTRLSPTTEEPGLSDEPFEGTADTVSNRFYSVSFNKDGTVRLLNKVSGREYERLHVLEDFGDRGDEYTFGRVAPDYAHPRHVSRELKTKTPGLIEIEQRMTLGLYKELDESRAKRIGRVETAVESLFRFYRDSRRIEVVSSLTNASRDHRLRICFDLPFESDHTTTATHFGCIERQGDPETMPDESELKRTMSTYSERPSGIQSQKAFIRVDEADGTEGFTVFNKGLPEAELVAGRRLALTLLRSVGWLSRSDFAERPVHAGPAEPTPGAQEFGTSYEFKYGFFVHSSDEPLHSSADEAETAFEDPVVLTVQKAELPVDLGRPVVQLDNPAIRLSSMRVRNDNLLITLYNLSNKEETVEMTLYDKMRSVQEVKIDESVVRDHSSGDVVTLVFAPREIKLCMVKP